MLIARAKRGEIKGSQYICIYEPVHEISNNVVYATIKASDQPAQMRSLIRAFASRFYDCRVFYDC